MIIIQEVNKITKTIEDFEKKEWEFADIEHFGREIDWKKDKRVLIASENNEVLGVLELTIQSGVMHVEGLIIKHNCYGKGIGKSLMQKAEEIAANNNLHKIYLETGKNWKATKFYDSLGYKVTGELPNHMEHQDYIEYTKFL